MLYLLSIAEGELGQGQKGWGKLNTAGRTMWVVMDPVLIISARD